MQWGLIFGGGRDDRRDSGLSAIAWIVVAPIIAMLLQLAVSRAREFGADASGARLTGDPEALAEALERLDAGSQRRPYEHAGPATAHLFIVNPLRGGAILKLLSTHPPVEERVARLRAMAASSGEFADRPAFAYAPR
jgi:heat shock protein HtpX